MWWSEVPGRVFWSIRIGLFLQTTHWCFRVSQLRVLSSFYLVILLASFVGTYLWFVDNAGSDRRGHIVEWVEKASFVRLNKLFEITAAERQYATLLTARNLMAVVWESREYVINILPRKLPKKVVPGEHYILKDLPFYKEVQQVDAEKRRALLDDRERRKNEGTLRKAPGQKRSASSPPAGAPAKKKKKTSNKGKEVEILPPPEEVVIPPSTYVKEVTIKEPKNPVPVSVSSGPGHLAGLNHSVPRCRRLAVWPWW